MTKEGTEKRLRVAIYSRVSRDDTGEGQSNERQEEACRLLCQMRGWEVTAIERDVSKSAYDPSAERPGWDQIKRLMESGDIDVVVVWKLDRVTRRVAGLVDLILLCEETSVSFATTDGMLDLTSPTGKAVATILAAVAQMEVELKAERQKLANQQRRNDGQPWKSGWRSFGYTLDGELVPEEADLIRQAADDVLNGTPLREIVRRWKALGVSTPRSEKGADGWTHNGVRSILLNPKNAGYVTYKGEVIGDGNWKPIIERDTFALLTAKLTDPTRRTNGPGRKPATLLTGIATCGVCGDTIMGRTNSKQEQVNGVRTTVARFPVYSCKGYHVALKRDEVDRLVIDAFAIATMTNLPGMVLSIPKPGQGVEVAQALEEETQRLRDLTSSFASGKVPLMVLEAGTAEIQERIDALEASIRSDSDYDPRKLNGEALRRFAELDTDGRRAILRRVARVTVHPKAGKGAPVLQSLDMAIKVTSEDGTSEWVDLLKAA